jgi:hypothetical protein
MTAPGWYPDQNGGSGKKYWDGKAWHDAVPVAPSLLSAGQSAPASPGPDTFLPKPASRSKNIKNMLWWGLGGVVALIVVSNVVEQIWLRPAVRSSAPVPNLSVPSVGVPGVEFPSSSPAVRSQDADMGSGLVIKLEQIRLDGTFAKATAAVKVGNLEKLPPGVLPSSGTLYAVGVVVAAVTGTVDVNPFYFAARTQNGTNLMPTAVENMLPAAEIPEGQKVAGFLGFDVPAGQSIAEIVLSDPLGAQLGRWLVK